MLRNLHNDSVWVLYPDEKNARTDFFCNIKIGSGLLPHEKTQ